MKGMKGMKGRKMSYSAKKMKAERKGSETRGPIGSQRSPFQTKRGR